MVKIQAHRGYNTDYPESTLLAYRKAHEAGSHGLETDIRKTKDGEFVLIHDATIDRTVAGGLSGNVEDYTLAELKQMDFSYQAKFGATYQGRADCKIITLSEFLDEFKDKNVTLVLQLKIWMNSDILAVVDMVISKGMLHQCHFFGDMIYIGYIKTHEPNAFTYNDGMPGISSYKTFLDNAIDKNHDAVSINANASESDLITMISEIHNAGKLVHTSTVATDFFNKTKLLADLGADMILGDDPTEMLKAIEPTITKIRNSSDVLVYKNGWHKSVETLVKSDDTWVKMLSIKVRM